MASDPSGAHAAAARLRADVQRLHSEGRLSSADAQSLLVAAGQVDNRISNEVHTPAPSVTSASPTTPAPAPKPAGPAPKPAGPAKGPGHDHGPGKHGKDGGG